VQGLALPPPATQARHVGLGPSFINEHQPRRIDPGLILLPPGAPSGDIRPVLFGCVDGFF
jgi:hypothetical protein